MRPLAAVTLLALFVLPRGDAQQARPQQTAVQPVPVAPSHSDSEIAAQWALVIVGAITAGFICWQAVLTKRAVRTASDTVTEVRNQTSVLRDQASAASDNAAAAKKSAELALTNVNLAVAKERPWIKIAVDDFKPAEPLLPPMQLLGLNQVSFKVLCSCPTRAFIVRAVADAYVLDGALGRIVSFPISALPQIINETATFETKVFVVPEPDCLAKIQAGKLHFQASIRYRGDYLPETYSSFLRRTLRASV